MGRKGSDLSKHLRLEIILNFLEKFSRDEGLTTRQINALLSHAYIDSSLRTTLRDLEELSLNHPISEKNDGNERRWVWARSTSEARAMSEMRYKQLSDFFDYFQRSRQEIA